MLFNYIDEPLTGRGDPTGAGDITSNLVVDEDFAFGLVDATDTPKYDYVKKVRTANFTALASLGLLPSCKVALNAAGQSVPPTGGTIVINIATGSGCPWSPGPLPSWITVEASSGNGPASVTLNIAPNTGADQAAAITVGGTTSTIEQQAPSIGGLNFIGSMPHLAAEGGWLTTFTFVNKGASPAIAREPVFAQRFAAAVAP